jgi:hypothetical protein
LQANCGAFYRPDILWITTKIAVIVVDSRFRKSGTRNPAERTDIWVKENNVAGARMDLVAFPEIQLQRRIQLHFLISNAQTQRDSRSLVN